ncbi:hypothetical protein L3Q82_014238 [Scortum barcoo]|uniref:Uncharacterized protein n=1 Tax=Scortum barcoo TaxID=214431 RepID=A0ACB8VZD9_9TELE|nr:hypothetical protein L3Q82_014238 [Scortum barcoo]
MIDGNETESIFIDEKLLTKAIVEQVPEKQTAIVKREGILFSETLKLCLAYRDILMINHLWEFTSLARLDLNNNLIERIENLDRLVNLTWLNLSFNSIEKIEGLDSLRKLEMLNLSNNKISVIENMDALEKLTHFCFANNLLGQLENVLYLRKFKNLFTLNLRGNPLSKGDDYKFFIAAYFPDLRCLDYRLLDQKTRIVELQQLSDPDLLKVKINDYNDEIDQLCKSLMAVEIQLVSQLEDVINKFDINISDMVGNFSETVQGIYPLLCYTFAQCRDLEDNYHEKVKTIAVATLENVAKDNLQEDLPEDVKMLFTDRDAVMDALTTSHDNHLLKINDRETQLVSRLNSWKVALFKGIQDKELKQNRMRISDIHRYVDHLREQLDELQ